MSATRLVNFFLFFFLLIYIYLQIDVPYVRQGGIEEKKTGKTGTNDETMFRHLCPRLETHPRLESQVVNIKYN